ncbi:MAG: DUF721 domain-containing protein [Actinomycetota bacterium]|nr:DUF721 domain-containing protein [Actinomycetota bacterium]
MDELMPIGPTLAGLAEGWGLEKPVETGRLFARWEAMVGSDIASRCKPTSLQGGVLKVRTGSPAWASELKYLEGQIVARLNKELGQDIVKRIKPWVSSRREAEKGGGQCQPVARAREQNAAKREQAERAADALAAGLSDEVLAASLKRAFRAATLTERANPSVVYLDH